MATSLTQHHIPPLPFFVAFFTNACHDFLLQVGNREAFKGARGRGVGEKVDTVGGRRALRRSGSFVVEFKTGDIILKHIGDILETTEEEERSSLEL
jgi:hypothetical protein